jgi:hypothetical protein
VSIGFVYVLESSAVPGLIKIGCTERSPHARAEELSRGSGVPEPFSVTCYVETERYARVETLIHLAFRKWRPNDGREFFKVEALRPAVAALFWSPWHLSFCGSHWATPLEARLGIETFSDLKNPWRGVDIDPEWLKEICNV